MDELVVRTTPGQLRGLRNYLVGAAAGSVLLVLGSVLTDGSLSTRLVLWGAGFGISFLIGLWAYAMYARAFTECSAAGIRTRGLAGQIECPWSGVDRIALRHGRRTVTMMVTTSSGNQFQLGAPVNGGAMGDPEFGSKAAAILRYWRTMTQAPPTASVSGMPPP